MYSRCDRDERERFFDLLDERARKVGVGVDALGACGGGRRGETEGAGEKRGDRFKNGWHDDAVEIYRDYAFVVSFENVKEEGYFTEKIVNPLLAGAVPVYWGWDGVGDIFKGVLKCGDDLEECADKVVDMWVTGEWREVAEMGRLQDQRGMKEWFGWEEGEGKVVEEIKEAFRMAGGTELG